MIATLEDLDEDALIQILTQPKNALCKQYQELFGMEGVKLTFSDNALDEVSKEALSRKTGARGLRAILEDILLDTMFDLPSMENAEEIVVNKDVIQRQGKPLVIYGDGAKKAKKGNAKPTKLKVENKDDQKEEQKAS